MASAKQVMLGRIIDTALAAPDRPFERRPRFVDDAAHNDYMRRLVKHGKKAMDAELHDATYGDALSPQKRIALAKLKTRAWKGDPKAQAAVLVLMARSGQPRAQQAVAAMKKAGASDSMGFSVSKFFHYATAPIWLPAKGIAKVFAPGKGGGSPEQVRLAQMKAAYKRKQAAEARAAAADAQSEAEQRAQQAIADAADAEADAADAEAAARAAKTQTAEAQANPDSIPTADDAEGWGFKSMFKKVGRGLKKGLTTYNPAYRIAKKGFDITAKRFLPNRDAQKARMVKSLYKRLWFEHANWLAQQDRNAGLALKSRDQYEMVAKLWAKAEIEKQHLPTQFAVSGATILGSAMLPEVMGSWWNPLSWFGAQSQTVMVNTADKRSATGPDDQSAQPPEGMMDPNAQPYDPSTDPNAVADPNAMADPSLAPPDGSTGIGSKGTVNPRAASLLGMMR